MTGGIILLLSGVAHGFGWLQLRAELGAARVPADVAGALAVGWYFGNVALASLVIGGSYLAFGLAAFVARDFNPLFLLFIVTGLLVGFPAIDARRHA